MAGTLVTLLVSEGESVVQGQLLMVMEAMKMEHQLKAGRDGVIANLSSGAGQQVRQRQPLLTINLPES